MKRMLCWIKGKISGMLMFLGIAILFLIKICKEGKNFSTKMINPED